MLRIAAVIQRIIGIAVVVAVSCWCNSLGAATAPADSARTASSATLTLQQVVEEVVRHNDRVAAMRFMEAAAKAKIAPAGAWDDPMLMLGVANLPTSFDFKMDPMTMRMIGLSLNIPYAGQKGLQKKAAESEAAAATEDLHGTELDLATAAKLAYFDLLFSLRTADLISRQVQVTEDVVSSVKSQLAISKTNPEDVSAAQADLWRLQTQLLPSAHAVESARYNLNSLRGLPTDTPVPDLTAPPPPSLPENPQAWLDAARKRYPPLRRLAERSKSYVYSASAMRRMRWPMLGLSGSYNIRSSTEMEKRDNMVGFQATISLPIFLGRQEGRLGESMEFMRQSVDAEAAQLWRDIETRVKTLFLDAVHLSENLRSYRERIIPADEDARQAALAGFTNNRTSFSTLLNYTLTIFRDRLTANQIEYDLARTLTEIENYTSDPAQWGVE
jgi:outer membrane protein TolC